MASELEQRLSHQTAHHRITYEHKKAILRRKYRRARELGFSAKESQALSFWTWEAIEALAAERKEGKQSD